ncbi:hypothetical protein CCACVL1_20209 [Corchorus capsularis]|uniref:Uncharacterized protein n=1 Tax=Corchorus capsularis TaxID=210143 RepID=A0A1R3HCA3_COCAP|nr:hypothetical protein CCACVL1_20209 [Corchorus capsularis]
MAHEKNLVKQRAAAKGIVA